MICFVEINFCECGKFEFIVEFKYGVRLDCFVESLNLCEIDFGVVEKEFGVKLIGKVEVIVLVEEIVF